MRRAALVLAVLASLTLVVGCGGSSSEGGATTSTAKATSTTAGAASSTSSTSTSAPASTSTTAAPTTVTPGPASTTVPVGAPPISEAGCRRYLTLTQLFADLEVISGGANSTQVAADAELAAAIAELEGQPGAADERVAAALDVLSRVSFQVTDQTDGPSSKVIDAALLALAGAFQPTCTSLGVTTG